MKQVKLTVKSNKMLTPTTYRMRLEGDVSAITQPGQFINLKLDGHFLRRPISVCDVESSHVTIIYKVLGQGTEEMTHLESGTVLDVLTGLGTGFDSSRSGDAPVLIGGGVGIPPLYLLAKQLISEKKKVTVILGYNSEDEIYYADEFAALGCEVKIATADGSLGIKGFVTDAYKELKRTLNDYTYFYTCGPTAMLKAIYRDVYTRGGVDGEFSFEERMGCGYGACMGCSVLLKTGGYKRICKDGPVLRAEEIYW